MLNEAHRLFCIDVFKRYTSMNIESKHYSIKNIDSKSLIEFPDWKCCIYVLKMGDNFRIPGVANIINSLDNNGILYVGGHMPDKRTSRFNKLIASSRSVERFFIENKYSPNDMQHSHSVAGCLTTSLLETGFTIENCIIELINGDNFDELEFIIGYQEKYHHLPPWNSLRKGATSWRD